MTLEDAVDLVLFAFEHGNAGDIFVQKSPASTIATLAESLNHLYKAQNEVVVIGTRHGEKLYETLVNREEMAKAENLEHYYRIPADNRDLNYARYFSEGEPDMENMEEYHSHNTHRLDVQGTKDLLMKLSFIREDVEKLNNG
jgi:UDP-glucose 4-epimerase